MNSSSSTECPCCRGATEPFALGRETFHRCPACGFIRKDASLHPSLEAERARYDRHQNAAGDGYDQVLETFLKTAVLPFSAPCEALDFGCGRSGRLLERMRQNGFSATGYDPFYAPAPTVLERRYGLVTATEVVEHFRDPETAWRQLCGLVAEGGILAMSTRLIPADFTGWWYRRDETHLCFYTERALVSIACRFGLRVLHTDAAGVITFHRD